MNQLLLYVKGIMLCCPFFQAGVTPMYIACWKGHRDIVDCLLRANADVNRQTGVRNNLICYWRLRSYPRIDPIARVKVERDLVCDW